MDRQIARSGSTFQTILDDVREKQARNYLCEDRRPLSDIAGLLGFESLASFSRWFRTRFDSAPSGWRRSHPSEARR
jgi:AraC-like DNA-binding protein